jgi:hypothetical protein
MSLPSPTLDGYRGGGGGGKCWGYADYRAGHVRLNQLIYFISSQ